MANIVLCRIDSRPIHGTSGDEVGRTIHAPTGLRCVSDELDADPFMKIISI